MQLGRIIDIRFGKTLPAAFAGQLMHAMEMSGIIDSFKALPGDTPFARHRNVSASRLCSDKVLHFVIPDGIRHDNEPDAISATLPQLMDVVPFAVTKSTVVSVEVSNSP